MTRMSLGPKARNSRNQSQATIYNLAMHPCEYGRQAAFTPPRRRTRGQPVHRRPCLLALAIILPLVNAATAETTHCPDAACVKTPYVAAQDSTAHNSAAQCVPAVAPRAPSSAGRSDRPSWEFGDSRLDAQGNLQLTDGVELRQGDRVLRAREMQRDPNGIWTIPGPVELADPSLILRGDDARITESGSAQFTGTEFELPDRAGHGSAGQIELSQAGTVDLTAVRYTTCPGPKPDWALKIGTLHIDAQAHVGTASNARLEVKGVPVVYLPYISFPVGDVRKSGLLFPDVGNSDFSGRRVSAPWYWNIAPNYDATITPTWYSQRGVDLGAELRLLTRRTRALTQLNFLANDEQTGEDRSYLELHTSTDITQRLRLEIDGTRLSDTLWLQHFGSGAQATGVTVLPRTAALVLRGDEWTLGARAQNYYTIDPNIGLNERPYTLLPQLTFRGWFPDRPWGLTWAMEAEYSNFRSLRGDATLDPRLDAQRFDTTPEVRLPLRGSGMYVEPALAWRYTAYLLEETASNVATDRRLSRSAPTFSLDSGMIFERPSGRDGQRLQTLEPRVMYLYVPYRQQDNLPIFDTTLPDFNLVQLFRTSRYVGPDRLGDANQVAMGATSRLLDGATGQQYLSATLGAIYRFADPRVGLGLPDESVSTGGSSDVIGELSLANYKYWSANLGLQWDPDKSRIERNAVSVQYRHGNGRVVNAGYRFREDTTSREADLKQVDASAAWPIGNRFSLYGHLVYSLQDNAEVERMAGFEYRDCCWGLRFVIGRSVSLTGETNNSWQLQIELKGLASVGNRVDTFLGQSIPGYSAARDDSRLP